MNGDAMIALIEELYPICRSLTGDGVRETLRRIKDRLGDTVPFEMHEVPSGTPALDWTVPDEWNIRAASIRDATGKTLIDFADSNLHVVGYSVPVEARLTKEELEPHLHSLPEQPNAIPWRTTYYEKNWGFCLRETQRSAMGAGPFDVSIDATLAPGHLSYGEIFLPGKSDLEFLVSVHVCHPSLVNDNLSGIAVATALAANLSGSFDFMPNDPASPHTAAGTVQAPRNFERLIADRRLGVRILFVPGTIGSLTWLSRNRDRVPKVVGGLTLTCLGDTAPLTYKRTFSGQHPIDSFARSALARTNASPRLLDFYPYGYDERQYNSPGFRMPIGSLMRSRHGRFPEYHTSLDNPQLIAADRLEEAKIAVVQILAFLDGNRRYRSLVPDGEPQLGRRGIYRAMGGGGDPEALQYAMLWLLQAGDGEHSLLDVSERSEIAFETISAAADLLAEHDLIEWLEDGT